MREDIGHLGGFCQGSSRSGLQTIGIINLTRNVSISRGARPAVHYLAARQARQIFLSKVLAFEAKKSFLRARLPCDDRVSAIKSYLCIDLLCFQSGR